MSCACRTTSDINEALDIWAEGVPLPVDLREGDLIALLTAGGCAQAMASDHCMRGGAPETLIWGGRAEALSTAAESFGGGGAMPLGVPVFDNVLKALEIRTSDDGAGLEVELGAEPCEPGDDGCLLRRHGRAFPR